MKRFGNYDECGSKSKVKKRVSSILSNNEEIINPGTTVSEDEKLKNTTVDSKESWFSNLPDEVILHIFSFMSFRELFFVASFVDRRWRRLSKDCTLFTELSLRGSEIPLNTVLRFLKNATRLKSLEMVERHDVNAILYHVIRYNTKLESLVIKGCKGSVHTSNIAEEAMCLVQLYLEKLKTLTVKDSQFVCNKFFRQLNHTLPALKKFNFVRVGPFEHDCPLVFHEKVLELEELGCQYFPMTSSDCTRLTKRCSDSLIVLKLNAHNITDENIEEISNCSKLRKLYLDHAEMIHDFGLLKIAKLHIESLYISCASMVTTAGWISFFKSSNLRFLRKLEILACITVTDRVVNTIAFNCRELETVWMPYCFNISGQGLATIIKMCKGIKCLSIENP